MKTLVPARFLRVRDKFVPDFLFEDTELSRGAGYLYVYLFSRSYYHGVCRVSQERLAHVGKCCVRSVQTYLRELVELQYLEIHRDPDSGRSVYRLLRSPRVLGLIRAAEQAALEEVFFVPGDTQNLPEGGANFAPAIKKKEEIYISPLSPLPDHPVRASSNAARCMPPSPPARHPHGRGGFLSSRSGEERRRLSLRRTSDDARERQTERTAAEADFERLFAAWPVKKDRRTAERIFHSLRRAGRLPDIDTLLATVERFQREDKHWRNGCPPLLTSWLRGERWHDEPFQPQQAEIRVEAPVTLPRPLPETRPVPFTEAERRGMGEFAAVTRGLRALWPSEGGAIPAALTRAKLRGISLPGLLARAQAFARDAARPVSFGDWMREVWVS